MRQRVSVCNDEKQRRQGKEGEKRQFGIEEGKFDGTLQQKIAMRNRAGRDRDIAQNEEIGES